MYTGLWWGNLRERDHLWGRVEVYTGLWWGNLRERDHLEDPGMMDFQEVGCEGMD